MKDEPPRPRPRKATGPERPSCFTTADVDRVMAILLALISEVGAIRERLDSHERLAGAGATPSVAQVEAYLPDDAAEAARGAWQDAYIKRLFRVITEDVEALKGHAPAA